MRPRSRLFLPVALGLAVVAPGALAATPTATTASPATQTAQQPAPGSAFAPLANGVDTGTQATTTDVTPTKRAGQTSDGHSTLIFLSLVALVMIAAVGVFIWWEGRKTATIKRRRQRMRSGRGPRALAATGADSRRGPPPPPRKRRQQAKRKKR